MTIASSVALFWIALGILVCYGATRLGLGSVTEPGRRFHLLLVRVDSDRLVAHGSCRWFA